ncbi:IS110 family transposase [Salinibacter ruber]|uniref:IS110 family transposase n=1 Tax=Salinibacter ruber TaxID=146919 RepID=UPI00216A5506|nr:IS110 family transposase [Salinibacter ruber]MCS4039958.1 transposase [Salinibacter ruber]
MLNVTTVRDEVHTENLLVVGVDVSKDKLDLYAEHTDPSENRRQELDSQIPNRSDEIEAMLCEFASYAEERGLEGLLVICEPTGGYEDQLFEAARRLGHETAYANGEHVSKASVIESGDPGKTDSMDARVIAMIGQMDKTQDERVLEGEHALLRELGRMYEAEDQAVVRARCRLHDLLRKLFCDLEKGKKLVFSTTGRAVAKLYGWNPQNIVDDGQERFRQKMKEKVKGVHEATLETLWEQANRSVRQHRPPAERKMLEERLRQLWADYTRHEKRKEEIARWMGELFTQLNRKGEAPDPVGNLDEAMMARLIGESGPLSDFDHWREVLHYYGLNLYERESGTYKGETKISKKGRSRFRKVLGQAAFALVQGNGPFSTYFERKRAEGMNYWKALVATMRKLCKVLYGLATSGGPYDPTRVSTCESQYAGAH